MTTLNGKIALVTGATSGLGQSTARALAKMGATVVIVGRSPQKTADVVQEIRTASGNSKVESLLADLSSQADIHRLASEFKRKYSQLHILVNNAGATYPDRQLSVDGIEMTFALNHMAYFLLTTLLLDTLKASAPARIVNVASGLYGIARLDFANLQGERFYNQFSAYATSKLENILFTRELARRLQGTGVTVNALNPRIVNTPMQHKNKDSGLIARVASVIMPLIGRSPEKGAETSIYLASSPEVEGVSGHYFVDCKDTPLRPGIVTDDVLAARLWDVSEKLVKMTPEMA
jgi:NAD(P)-dependent dehydrogenase (short-subunit alcohol dehydrogenase family)